MEKKKTDWWLYTIPILVVFTIAAYIIVQSRMGLTSVLVFYIAPLVIGFLAIVFLICGIIRSILRRPFLNTKRVLGFVCLLALCFTGVLYGKFPSSYDDKPSKIEFILPLDTTITVGWGGGTEEQNYHVVAPDQCWAYDMLVSKENRTYEGDSTKLENYFCYGLPVIAPANGEVVSAVSNEKDIAIGGDGNILNPFGNHVIIKVAPKEFLFICHLKPGSITVKKGDRVIQKQVIAQVGNSGNTSEPHVHIHLQDTQIPSFGEGIPLQFHNYELNGKIIEKGIPTGGIDIEKEVFTGQIVRNAK